MKILNVIIFISFIIYGCDVPGKLIIENKSGKDASYRCEFFEKDSVYEVVFNSSKNENIKTIIYGFGNLWSNERIKEYVSSIKMIQIKSISDSLTLLNKEEMYNFFKRRRKGLLKDEIKIVIR